MNNTQKSLAVVFGSALALSLATSPVNAAENPFAATTLSSGYQVAEHHEKSAEGKCGGEKSAEGKCGSEKSAEGKCGGEKAKEGKCGTGKCGAEKAKAKEGKCGTGKCGNSH